MPSYGALHNDALHAADRLKPNVNPDKRRTVYKSSWTCSRLAVLVTRSLMTSQKQR